MISFRRYRKKPVIIWAIQVFPNNVKEISDELFTKTKVIDDSNTEHILAIETLEGTMYANSGDWIIQGVQNEIYPCKPDIFKATYDQV